MDKKYSEISSEFHAEEQSVDEGEVSQVDVQTFENAGTADLTDTAEPDESAAVETPEPTQSAEDSTNRNDSAGMLSVLDAADEDLSVVSKFKDLYDRNNDLVGWIEMAESVDYPVVRRDNTFYMDHDFDGKSSSGGTIFLDERNKASMTDSGLLIYGHNMNNGSMFGDLDKYRNIQYYYKYPIITLKSAFESEPRKYVLFSMFDASMNRNDPSYIRIIRTNFENDEDMESYIAEVNKRSMYASPIEVSAGDQLLTLVTCSYSLNNGRFLLFARRLRDDETETSVVEQFRELAR